MGTDQPKAAKNKTQVVVWAAKNHFEERQMRYEDWARFGAPDLDEQGAAGARPADTVWEQANKWTVTRSSIPLSDEELATFLLQDANFSLAEV